MIEHYIQHYDGEAPVRVEVDLSLAEEAPQFERPLLLWVFVKMPQVGADGLCAGDACALCEALREAVDARLSETLRARFSGSRMSEGWYELYFYARSAKRLVAEAGAAVAAFEGYSFDAGSSRDEAWEHYFESLYPDGPMQHQIQSRHIITELAEAGDDITVEREVEHILLFQLPTQADRAVAKLTAAGYRLEETFEEEGEYPCGRVMVKTQDVTEATMQHSAEELLECVIEEHGRYEGWSTTISEA